MAGEIYAAMAAILGELPAISKGKTNTQQNFKYRGIDDVYYALKPLMAKYGVFSTPEVLESRREERVNAKGTVLAFVTTRVKYTFYAKDGSSVCSTVEGEGMDSGDKATSKSLAIAHKYAVLQTFCIPTEDMPDPDGEAHQIQEPDFDYDHATFDLAAANDKKALKIAYDKNKIAAYKHGCGDGFKASYIRRYEELQAMQASDTTPKFLTDGQRKYIMAHYGTTPREDRIKDMCKFLGREIKSFSELTTDEAGSFIDIIEQDKQPQEATSVK